MDNIKPGKSTIPNAGRGGFATRDVKAGDVILPLPMVHIPNKAILDIHHFIQYDYEHERYHYDDDANNNNNSSRIDNDDNDSKGSGSSSDGEKKTKQRQRRRRRQQLLLNYCFGHPKSSVVLFPYSHGIHYINHRSSKPNAFVRWATVAASPSTSTSSEFSSSSSPFIDIYHQSSWLSQNVTFLEEQNMPGLMMELVAYRDITAGEEVFIDYGRDWEEAYDAHLRDINTTTTKDDDEEKHTTRMISPSPSRRLLRGHNNHNHNHKYHYVPSQGYNQDAYIRTITEQAQNPYYPPNVETYCFYSYNGDDDDDDRISKEEEDGNAKANDIDLLSVSRGDIPILQTDPISVAFDWWEFDGMMTDSYHFDRFHPCKIIKRSVVLDTNTADANNNTSTTTEESIRYTALLRQHIYTDETLDIQASMNLDTASVRLVTNMPRRAIRLVDKRYTSDVFDPNAFRRAISLPDDTFPDSWMNHQ